MNESNENFGSLIPLTFLVILGVTGYVIYNHGLTTDQLISLMRTLTWPFVVILILTNNKTWSLINSITDIEFPGVIKASRKTQQKTEVPEESTQFGDSKNEEVEFKKLEAASQPISSTSRASLQNGRDYFIKVQPDEPLRWLAFSYDTKIAKIISLVPRGKDVGVQKMFFP